MVDVYKRQGHRCSGGTSLLLACAGLLVALGGLGLFTAVAGLTCGQVVPVDGAGVKIGAVDAGELGLAAHLDAAATAHAGACLLYTSRCV